MGIASVGVLAVVLSGFKKAFQLSTEVTAVGVVGAVALRAMGNVSPDMLLFASGVGLWCTMLIGPIDVSTSSTQLNPGIFFAFLLLFSSPFSLLSSLLTASSSSLFLSFPASEASASRIANAAHKFPIAFQIPSGNGPDQVSFHSNSICRSLALHCATVLSAADVFIYVGTAIDVATTVGLTSGCEVCVAVM
jgi:hypothetical protein